MLINSEIIKSVPVNFVQVGMSVEALPRTAAPDRSILPREDASTYKGHPVEQQAGKRRRCRDQASHTWYRMDGCVVV